VSTCSFHATKIFHSGEGGAMFCNDEKLFHKLYYSHNFGHNGPIDFHGLGINAKISELQSAMGLAVFDNLEHIFDERRKVVEFYLKNLNFDKVTTMKIREKTEWNYSYFPLIFQSEEELLSAQKRLNEAEIFPRRYFYPSLNTIDFVNGASMPISESIASRILCLPLYVGLTEVELKLIVNLIN
jgi:dTDP-4-amino-4,6-dideoxygalactose transaminase